MEQQDPNHEKVHKLLDFWFGSLSTADLPTSNRTSLWFGNDPSMYEEMATVFDREFQAAINNELTSWSETPRGRLALILLYDQFPRFIYPKSKDAFAYDKKAQVLCADGLELDMDQSLTLIERVFFYMPLVHADDERIQEESIRLYQELVSLSMSETTQVYQLFLAYAYAHFRVIKEFGRFPQRNDVLGRESTKAELNFLKSA